MPHILFPTVPCSCSPSVRKPIIPATSVKAASSPINSSLPPVPALPLMIPHAPPHSHGCNVNDLHSLSLSLSIKKNNRLCASLFFSRPFFPPSQAVQWLAIPPVPIRAPSALPLLAKTVWPQLSAFSPAIPSRAGAL